MTTEFSFPRSAFTFDELLNAGNCPPRDAPSEPTDEVAKRIKAWRVAGAHGDRDLFTRRLARDGWTESAVTAAFASPEQRQLPSWVGDADWIRKALRERAFRPQTVSVPFGDVFTTCIDAAHAQVHYPIIFTETAQDDRRQHLLGEIAHLCAPALFDRFRTSGLDYTGFVDDLDMDALFHEKPVLLRLIAVLARQWIDNTNDVCRRLVADADEIRVLTGSPVGARVTGISAPLSDRHRGGQAALTLLFGDGSKIVYKPKDLRVDAAWGALIDWLNNQEPPTRLQAARVLDRNAYGWSEFIEHTGCADRPSLATYFRRAGSLLALLYCLSAADMHHENIIAHADQPVPIDLEAILQGHDEGADEASPYSALHAARGLIAESVLSVGLLPGYARTSDGRFIPAGGLAAGWSDTQRVGWRNINTRSMLPVTEPVRSPTSNLPHFMGEYCSLDEHFELFVKGFEDYAAFLRSLDWSDVLPWFSEAVVRTVHRPTQFYSLLLDRLSDDRTMDDGVVWSVQADFLARLADWDDPDDTLWSIQRRERESLYALDVPHFETSTDNGLARARGRISRLDDAEISWQVSLIRQTSDTDSTAHVDFENVDDTAMSDEQILSEADGIADHLSQFAIRRGLGAAWLGLNWRSDSGAAHPAVLGQDLYSGNCGIALFLAAHARVRDCAESAALARAALAAILADCRGANAGRVARLLGTGGVAGLGSLTYGLTVIAHLLDDPQLRAEAQRAANLITEDLIAADTRFDVVGGTAGAILGLLRLHRDVPTKAVLDAAIWCGDHLLNQRPADQDSVAGMAHGAAGFAYSLHALSEASGLPRFSDESQRWLDVERLHRQDSPAHQPQWCHGTAGTGLCLIAIADSGRSRSTNEPALQNALQAAIRHWPDRVDTLCCGTLGNVELLAATGKHDLALRRLSHVVRAKDSRGTYRWSGGSSRFNVGLFRGLAGVGYTCLRTIDRSLPNVLVLQ